MEKNERAYVKTAKSIAEFAEEMRKAFAEHGFEDDQAFVLTKIVLKQVVKHNVSWKAHEYEC